jgi:hypothetical protein
MLLTMQLLKKCEETRPLKCSVFWLCHITLLTDFYSHLHSNSETSGYSRCTFTSDAYLPYCREDYCKETPQGEVCFEGTMREISVGTYRNTKATDDD